MDTDKSESPPGSPATFWAAAGPPMNSSAQADPPASEDPEDQFDQSFSPASTQESDDLLWVSTKQYPREHLDSPESSPDEDPKDHSNQSFFASTQETDDLSWVSEKQLPKEHLDSQESSLSEEIAEGRINHPEMRKALRALMDKNLTLMEYGTQLRCRCGSHEILIVAEWAVQDEQLSLASQALVEAGFPRLFGRERPEFGSWDTECFMHDLDGDGWKRVNLLPLSLTGLTLEETVKAPVIFAHEHEILTPKPPRYMISMIRHLLKAPIGHSDRFRVERDLESFISSYICHGPNLTFQCPGEDEWVETEEQYMNRIEDGVQRMKAWDWGEVDERHLAIAERVVRECRYINEMTDVH